MAARSARKPAARAKATNISSSAPANASDNANALASPEETDAPEEMDLLNQAHEVTLRVAVGTYEHLLCGLECQVIVCREAGEETLVAAKLEKTYISEPHAAPITAVQAAGHTLVTGSADELMQ
jgi:hypothetical protein